VEDMLTALPWSRDQRSQLCMSPSTIGTARLYPLFVSSAWSVTKFWAKSTLSQV